MRTTIDKAGRLVVPKVMRDRLGFRSGVVDITVDGVALRIEPVSDDELIHRDGRLVIPKTHTVITDDFVRDMRGADHR